MDFMHISYITNHFKGAISKYEGVLHCEVYDFAATPEDAIGAPLEDPFFSRRIKMFSRPAGLMLYGKLGINFFTTSEILYPNMKVRIRLIRTRTNFHMISDNPNVSLGIVDCSLYNRRITLKDDYHKKRMDMLANRPVDYNNLETLAKTLSFLLDRINLYKKKFSTMHQYDELPYRRTQILLLRIP